MTFQVLSYRQPDQLGSSSTEFNITVEREREKDEHKEGESQKEDTTAVRVRSEDCPPESFGVEGNEDVDTLLHFFFFFFFQEREFLRLV